MLCEARLTGTAIKLGAQDMSEHSAGAHTGEVSAAMLKEFGCAYALVGHSERRTCHHEDDQTIARKTRQAIQSGLTPILCVGETAEQRASGSTEEVLTRQLRSALQSLSPEDLSRLVIAYEPVWAIGTGLTATPEMAQQAHAVIRESVVQRTPILYGGSMKPENALELLSMPDIDGGLIGGASLKADDFIAILRAGQTAASMHQ
ncbi:triose-phosphate isomerase [Duganella radicis]|uniref:Triosephosphate isomerase n=2 Tax=Duganella radicis TaxID=551988 RepID=A0A6L6PPX5_9BURK|nr:triose-phosphate isomerase [Duganella radicis]